MSLETKGTIKYDPDVKPGDAEFTIECKPLGICSGVTGLASGDIDAMIGELTTEVRRAIQSEFHIPSCDIEITKYTLTFTFDVSAPINKTLDQFISIAERPDSGKIVETAKAIMEISKATGQSPQEVFDKAKAQLDTSKKKGGKS